MAKDTKTYWEKLNDPRWKSRRDLIRLRAKNSCEICGVTDVPLEVHHAYYEQGIEPWDYEETSLVCCCVPCHETEDEIRIGLRKLIGCMPPSVRRKVFGYVHAQYAIGCQRERITFVNGDDNFSAGVGDAFGLGIKSPHFCATVSAFDFKPMLVSDIVEMARFINECIKATDAEMETSA